MAAAAVFAALVLPVLVFYTGTATLGPYARGGLGEFGTLLSIEKARRMLGYEPQHSWRDHVEG